MPDGQSIAVRLSRRIKAAGIKVKGLLKAYNAQQKPTHFPVSLDYINIIQLDNPLWAHVLTFSGDLVPMKQRAVMLDNLISRAAEEKVLIKADVENACTFYLKEIRLLEEALQSLQAPDIDR
ncbi:hypothetical protein SKAU_G00136830 [Synaphobranchus kaupii]|uniref:Uncharacterized protein n=1 Tax=Synaphobranchus kaupii TaxID=118154 RepID=A0A9Q1FRK7_SYNKA|nr:hypothetical protein SKAU_G00136830 [Synaphobranchus kaupii]